MLEADGRWEGEVLVVDNDPDGSAGGTVEDAAGRLSCRVRYVHEPEPGISAARNAALAASSASRLLAFIDDDERPVPGWLAALVATWEAQRTAAIAGRVLEEFEAEPAPWIVNGGFFRRTSVPTGTRVAGAGAGNLLLDLDQIRAAGLRFDLRFGLSGGEDTMFCHELGRHGLEIAWCDEARIVDVVPVERAQRAWVLARARRVGNTSVRVALASASSAPARLGHRVAAALGGALRIVLGRLRWAWGSLVRDDRHHARGLRLAARGRGLLEGALGRADLEYARQQATP